MKPRPRRLLLTCARGRFYCASVLNLRRGPSRTATAVAVFLSTGFVLCGSIRCGAATEGAAATARPERDHQTPGSEKTAAPAETPKAEGAPCKEAIAKLSGGDVGALDELDDATKQRLLGHPATRDVVICFAVASGNRAHCDVLPAQAKADCLERFAFAQKLKGAPKKALKAELFYRICQSGNPKPPEGTCEKVRDAMVSGDASACDQLPFEPAERGLCAGLVTGDPTKCDTFEEPGRRAGCVAFVTGDPEKCAKGDEDCRRPLRSLAIMQKKGLAGIGDIDPISAAAAKGKEACAPLVANLEGLCEGGGGGTAPAPATSGPTPASE